MYCQCGVTVKTAPTGSCNGCDENPGLVYVLIVKEQQASLQGLQWLSWRYYGRKLFVLKPPKTLLGKRLTRKRLVATRLDPAIGSISIYPIPVGRIPAQRDGPATLQSTMNAIGAGIC